MSTAPNILIDTDTQRYEAAPQQVLCDGRRER